MARKKEKKKSDEVEGGVAPWLATYGDMITLVLTLFVLLYSFSSVDAVKWDRLVSSMSGTPFVAIQALDPSVVGPLARDEMDDMRETKDEEAELQNASPTPTPAPTPENAGSGSGEGNLDETKERFDELFDKIAEHIELNNLETKLNVEMMDNFIILHITDSTLFSSGQADIKTESRGLLADVSSLFNEYESIIKMIRIEGHTDNRSISTKQFPSNWELSITRATRVLKYFLAVSEVDDSKFSAVGYADNFPVANNDTYEGRAQNRRVDFMIESIYVYD